MKRNINTTEASQGSRNDLGSTGMHHTLANSSQAGGNPLKMIKEYTLSAGQPLINFTKEDSASQGLASNASTGEEFVGPVNEEAERINIIMNEPIENLLTNLEHLRRPISTRAGVGMMS
jgi:hypothetical protein